jgi:ATP-dependent exoDNAse (exonuclease V) beta subunit
VHALFEWAIRWRGAPSQEAADDTIVDRLWLEWRPKVPRQEALSALGTLRQSDLWGRLLAARSVLMEADVAGVDEVGSIDLAYADAAGWHLVDFKTDVAMDETGAAEVVERHAGQLRAYADIWQAATGERPCSLAVYLTDTGRCYAVD